MDAYSTDLRERVLAAWQAREGTQQELAARFRVTDRWIRKLIRQYRAEDSIEPKKRGSTGRPAFDEKARAKLVRRINEQPDLTLEQLKAWAHEELGITCSIMAVQRALEKEDMTVKKKRSRLANRTDRK